MYLTLEHLFSYITDNPIYHIKNSHSQSMREGLHQVEAPASKSIVDVIVSLFDVTVVPDGNDSFNLVQPTDGLYLIAHTSIYIAGISQQ